MFRSHLLLSLALAGAAWPAGAALQFTNVTSLTGVSANLRGVSYDGTANFVATGATNSTILRGAFTNSLSPGPNVAWSSTTLSQSLLSATYGAGMFLAGGYNASVFESLNGSQWVKTNNAFQNTAAVYGLAFNPTAGGSGRFAAVASIFEIYVAGSNLKWSPASLPQGSALESYNGVTAFGTGRFAACGIFGNIRLSADGGLTWTNPPGHGFDLTKPELIGIGSDGATRVVTVGVNGTLLYSGNSGSTWAQKTTPAGSINLNAAAWDNARSQFIVVGDQGKIMTSPDGATWTLQSSGLPSGFNKGLRGVTFANSGNLQGIGMLVGDNGTVVLAGSVPQAPINPVGATNCAGSPLVPLSVSIVTTDPEHPAIATAVDWFDGAGNLVTNNSTVFVPPDNTAPDNAPAEYTYFAQARDIRTGFVSTSRTAVTLTVNPRPKATLVPSETITNCNIGTSFILTNHLTGLGPWTVYWNDGLVQTADAPAGPVDLMRTVVPTNTDLNTPSNNVFYVTGVSNADTCVGNLPGDITGTFSVWVNPRPTATLIPFTTTVCNVGQGFVLTNTLTGIGPWTVTWNDGVVQTASGPGPVILTRPIIPTNTAPSAFSNNVFFVTSVSNADTCLGNFPNDIQGSVAVHVNPRPTAVVSGTNTICNGQSTIVQATLTGLGPWTVTWSSNGVVVATHNVSTPADSLTVSPVDSNPNGSTNALYVISALTDVSSGCTATEAGDLSGGALITINPRPTASVTGTNTICNGESTLVQATLTGLGPWNVTWSSNGIVVATHNGVGIPSDALTVTPVDANLNGSTNALYQVTALTDVNSGCTNNQPGDLTGGALITINPRPTASVTGTNAICNGESTIVQAVLTGLGPWNVTWSSNGIVVATHTGVVASTDTLTVTPVDNDLNASASALYQVTALTDVNTGCTNNQPGDLKGGALITINPRPTATVTGTNTICNGESSLVQAALTGLGPWNVTWSSNGIVVATHVGVAAPSDTLTVSPVDANLNAPATSVYQVTALTDVNTGCTNNLPGDLKGGALITINPRPTATVTGTNTICNGQSSLVQAALTGLGPWNVTWSSNGVVVATHTGLATPSDSLTVSPVDANPNAAATALYQVTALTDVNTGCTNNQPGDLKGGALITINPRPTATVTGTNTICNGQSTLVQAALTGLGPWNVTWSSNGIVVATHTGVGTPSDSLTVSPVAASPNASASALYQVTALTDVNSGCTNNQPGDLKGGALITINPRPTASVTGTNTICNGQSTVVQAALTGLGPWNVTWSSNGVAVVTHTAVATASDSLTVSPVNASSTATLTALYQVASLTDASPACTTNLPADLQGGALITVNPTPLGPTNVLNQTGCIGITNPTLAVSLSAPADTAYWYDSASNLVYTLGATYTPTNSVSPTNTAPVTFQYFVSEVNTFGCESTNRVPVSLVLEPCMTNLTITVVNTNAVLSWYGNYFLQQSFTLAPANWLTLTQGVGGMTNFSTNVMTVPPTNSFFRLYAPGN